MSNEPPGLYFNIIKKFKLLMNFEDDEQNREAFIIQYYLNTGTQISNTTYVCFIKSSGTSAVRLGKKSGFKGLLFPCPGFEKGTDGLWIIKSSGAWQPSNIIYGATDSDIRPWVPLPTQYFPPFPSHNAVARMRGICDPRNDLLNYFGCIEHLLISASLTPDIFSDTGIDVSITQSVYKVGGDPKLEFIPSKIEFNAAKKNGTDWLTWDNAVADVVNEGLKSSLCLRVKPSISLFQQVQLYIHSCWVNFAAPEFSKNKQVGGLLDNNDNVSQNKKCSTKSKSTIKRRKKNCKGSQKKH